jgi:mono/diheme cytochrome c family protein
MKASMKFRSIAIVGAIMIGAPAIALAVDVGKREYDAACASCHGFTGRGDGPLKEELKGRVSDLTVLARNNNGVFPFDRVYQIIDGREQVKAHGSREMPVWGNSFRLHDTESSAPSRIKALTEYLYRLQDK